MIENILRKTHANQKLIGRYKYGYPRYRHIPINFHQMVGLYYYGITPTFFKRQLL